ncbi:EF-hand domain-containing protein [Paraburkholderia rhizosphaerae]|nr:EF-hand domain-containing protein [Paraburkholderia rhizosphaerae]
MAFVAVSLPCMAQSKAAQILALRFADADADADADGKQTHCEAAAGTPRVAQYFDQIDSDRKRYVPLQDVENFVARHQARP